MVKNLNYSIKKNGIMAFVATWMNLEVIIPSNLDRDRQISCDMTYMWSLIYDTNEIIHKTEEHSQTQRTDL